jgi:post-segregation antitoxin (ccd killing protein)
VHQEFEMPLTPQTARKRPVNLTLNEALVTQAKAYTQNLSATMESLLSEFVLTQQQAQSERRAAAERCAMDWNDLHAAAGSFADEHTTL